MEKWIRKRGGGEKYWKESSKGNSVFLLDSSLWIWTENVLDVSEDTSGMGEDQSF